MAYDYSDPKRASELHALPDVETFEHDCTESTGPCDMSGDEFECARGWYWQACFPGCMPDGEPMGPFATEAEALADARVESDGEES